MSQATVGLVLIVLGLAADVVLTMSGRVVPSVVASVIVAGLGLLGHLSWSRANAEVRRLRTAAKAATPSADDSIAKN